ncbi:hypothetical protein K504DRAFT_456990 [Pleomassaria siparia CBS 279.74]|uniref:Uncharacterized protein n=1 Tax=Pleomassaria siparia CBS 279.74 TaxID=1314801 RepID=A0A6G1KQA0_9PLEO|nr:hypothetical protein K504DRAFT_456990 [Pleomassaria siparia CBS 279.74]
MLELSDHINRTLEHVFKIEGLRQLVVSAKWYIQYEIQDPNSELLKQPSVRNRLEGACANQSSIFDEIGAYGTSSMRKGSMLHYCNTQLKYYEHRLGKLKDLISRTSDVQKICVLRKRFKACWATRWEYINEMLRALRENGFEMPIDMLYSIRAGEMVSFSVQ